MRAAEKLFVEQGWAATGVRDIASAAGVSVETVYSHFSNKGGLLRAVVDVAVSGDDEPVPIAERPEFLSIGRGRRADRIRAAASLLSEIYVRTAPMTRVLQQAAGTDAEIAGLLLGAHDRRRLDVAAAFELIVGRPPTPLERDGLWAITGAEVYLLLVDESGWTADQYQEWMAATLERVLPRS
jgi:AcrR family transcriptional regulator